MILAEVKRNDEEEFYFKLFNGSIAQFRAVAERRYIKLGRIVQISDSLIIEILVEKFFPKKGGLK